MALVITHPFISLKGDGGDATLVRPSNWNAAHTHTMNTGKILARFTAGVGQVEELSTSAFFANAMNTSDGPGIFNIWNIGGFSTGDVKFSINPTAEVGWLAYNGEGTIGKAGSGATIYANALAQPLYELIYNNISDTFCPVSGGRTGNATNDFNAGKTIGMPRFSGRGIIGAGTGSGLTARTIGAYGGAETVVLGANDLPVHTHANSLNDSGHAHRISANSGMLISGFSGSQDYNIGPGGHAMNDGTLVNTGGNLSAPMTISNGNNTTTNTGHANMQPYIPLWAKVKL